MASLFTGSAVKFEAPGVAAVNGYTDDIGWEKIASKLDALITKGKGLRQRMCKRGLADAGDIFYQQMSLCQHAGYAESWLSGFADDNSVQRLRDGLNQGARILNPVARCAQSRSSHRAEW